MAISWSWRPLGIRESDLLIRSPNNITFVKRDEKDQISPHLDSSLWASNGRIATQLLKHVVDLLTRSISC